MALLFIALFVPLYGCFGQTREAIEKTELGNLQNYYATRDPHYSNIVSQLPNIQAVLNDLKTAAPGCAPQIDTALRRTTSAIQLSEQPQYGNIRALVSIPGEDDENRLAKVLACVTVSQIHVSLTCKHSRKTFRKSLTRSISRKRSDRPEPRSTKSSKTIRRPVRARVSIWSRRASRSGVSVSTIHLISCRGSKSGRDALPIRSRRSSKTSRSPTRTPRAKPSR